jgi:hypothetical protein
LPRRCPFARRYIGEIRPVCVGPTPKKSTRSNSHSLTPLNAARGESRRDAHMGAPSVRRRAAPAAPRPAGGHDTHGTRLEGLDACHCLELCSHMPSVKDLESFYSLLAPFEGAPADNEEPMLALITSALPSSPPSTASHTTRCAPTQRLACRSITRPCCCGGCRRRARKTRRWWFVIREACFFPDERRTAGLFYKQILPFSNRRPVLSNLAPGEAGGAGESASTAWIERGTRGRPARVHAGEPRGDDGTPAGRLRTAQGSRRLLWWRRRRQRRRVAGL